MRSNGQVTVEYAVCTGLLGALAIGGLILLGGNVNTLLQAPAKGQTSVQIDHLYNKMVYFNSITINHIFNHIFNNNSINIYF